MAKVNKFDLDIFFRLFLLKNWNFHHKNYTCPSENSDDVDDDDVTDVRGKTYTSNTPEEEKKIEKLIRRTLTAVQVNSSDLETDSN